MSFSYKQGVGALVGVNVRNSMWFCLKQEHDACEIMQIKQMIISKTVAKDIFLLNCLAGYDKEIFGL